MSRSDGVYPFQVSIQQVILILVFIELLGMVHNITKFSLADIYYRMAMGLVLYDSEL